MIRVFLDSTVLVHAVGVQHPMREPSRRVLGLARDSEAQVCASVEAVQELLHHRARRVSREVALTDARDYAASLRLFTVDHETLARALQLVEVSAVRGRDAVHAATALQHGFDQIVSSDSDLDGIPGLTRLSPAEAAAGLG